MTLFIVLKGLVDGPPPSVLFEKGHDKRSVVASTHESLVELKLLALKFQVNIIFFVHEVKQPLKDDAFGICDKLL